MPPEAFEGKSDARGDVYSLGLTLYELLAFRPAFDEKERGRLVKQVTHEAPPRLGTVNAEVPRDLETIVHKAIERDPSHRYADGRRAGGGPAAVPRRRADPGAADGRRRSGWRVGRGATRVVACLGAAVFVLLAVLAVGSTVAAWRIDREKVAAQAVGGEPGSGEGGKAGGRSRRPNARMRRRRGPRGHWRRRRRRDATPRRPRPARRRRARRSRRPMPSSCAAQDRVRAGLYASEMNLLQIAWKEDDLARVRELLARTEPKPGEPDLRGFEWWYWQRQARGEVRSLRLPRVRPALTCRPQRRWGTGRGLLHLVRFAGRGQPVELSLPGVRHDHGA